MDITILKEKITQMQQGELDFKKAWQNGGKDLLEDPMNYARYISYIQERRCIEIEESRYYTEMSEENLGNTIIEVGKIHKGEGIFMNKHLRYSYPVLHNHVYIEIIYVYSGSCTHFVDQKRFTMMQGDFCILAPHAIHALSVISDDTIVMNIMIDRHVFDGSFIDLLRGGKITASFFEDLFYKKDFLSPYVIYPTGDDQIIRGLIEYMYQENLQKEYEYKRSLLLAIQSIFIRLIRRYEMFSIVCSSTETSFNNHVVSILGYLSVNYNRTSLCETAAFFKYAPNYMGKMLKKYTGKNYTEIVLEYQLENAKRLIEEGNLSITEISQEIGCYDASHFTRKFKKKYGMSPTEYKEKAHMIV